MDARDLIDRRTLDQRTLRTILRRLVEAGNDLRAWCQRIDGRLDAAAEVGMRIRVMEAVADLPANADPTEWFRVRTGTVAERSAVYVGNGPNLPLSKVTTTAL